MLFRSLALVVQAAADPSLWQELTRALRPASHPPDHPHLVSTRALAAKFARLVRGQSPDTPAATPEEQAADEATCALLLRLQTNVVAARQTLHRPSNLRRPGAPNWMVR